MKLNKENNILFKISLLIILLFIYSYIISILFLPEKIILSKSEKLNLKTIYGTVIKEKSSIEVLSNGNKKIQPDKKTYEVNLFNKIKVKEIEVTQINELKVIPLGNSVGLKVYTEGVLVVGITNIEGKDNKIYSPGGDSKISEGDIITKVNNTKITKVNELINIVNSSEGKTLEIECISNNNKEKNVKITPVQVSDNKYKLGLWARDTAAGVGTLTLYNPETEDFAALGHGISDIDTENLLKIENGEIITTDIHTIIKGEKGKSGVMRGSLNNEIKIGNINKNSSNGIFGKITNTNLVKIDYSKIMTVAKRKEIKQGPAIIRCQLDNENIKEYNIEIEKIYYSNNSNNKSMLIKITDERLLNKTGGIIQGMSGSPIIQNNKFVGAVTHVLLENPEKGFGVFADMMIKNM